MTKSLAETLAKLQETQNAIAEKYKYKVSISMTTGLGKKSKEVVIADHREKNKN